MVTDARWKAAQSYERGFWNKVAREISSGAAPQLDWYEWRAGQLLGWLREGGLDSLESGRGMVVEVGSGPIGICSFFPAATRIAVDPLEPFYATNEVLVRVRNPEVDYREGTGEALPIDEGRADLLIIENCIDHVRDVDSVMREIRRVLRPGGILYLTVNCRSTIGFVVHRLLSNLAADAGHPHSFTDRRIEDLIDRHGFQRLATRKQSFAQAWLSDLRGPGARPRLKAALGVSEYLVSILARRP
jgi:SAM-dependent methyltransferase